MNFEYNEKLGALVGFCLVKSVEKKTNKNGGLYLDLTLSDKSGEINAKLWNYDERQHGNFETNDIIKVSGTVTQFNGTDQFKINRLRRVTPDDGVEMDDLVPSAAYKGERMFNELTDIASGFADKEISLLVTSLLNKHKEELLYYPAALKMHHAMKGGLLFHTLSIVRLAQSVCKVYPFVDSDLLLGGAMLHDLAKLQELNAEETGVATGYTVEGSLIGHLIMGAMEIAAQAEDLGIDRTKAVLLEHMLISHHGDPEFGSAIRPLFLEADILSALDRLDARVTEVNQATLGTEVGKFSPKQWALDNRSFFNHGRSDYTLTANLGIGEENNE